MQSLNEPENSINTESTSALACQDNPPVKISHHHNTNEEREELFIRNLFLCDKMTEAAEMAGYSVNYINSGPFYKRFKSAKFQDKVRKYAITHELLNVPKLLRLEDAALTYLTGKPQELPKFASILKQKKQIAGLLSHDVQVTAPTISIDQVQNLMLNVSQVTPKLSDNGSNGDK